MLISVVGSIIPEVVSTAFIVLHQSHKSHLQTRSNCKWFYRGRLPKTLAVVSVGSKASTEILTTTPISNPSLAIAVCINMFRIAGSTVPYILRLNENKFVCTQIFLKWKFFRAKRGAKKILHYDNSSRQCS